MSVLTKDMMFIALSNLYFPILHWTDTLILKQNDDYPRSSHVFDVYEQKAPERSTVSARPRSGHVLARPWYVWVGLYLWCPKLYRCLE